MGANQTSDRVESSTIELPNLQIISNFLDKDMGKLLRAKFGEKTQQKTCLIKEKELDQRLGNKSFEEYCRLQKNRQEGILNPFLDIYGYSVEKKTSDEKDQSIVKIYFEPFSMKLQEDIEIRQKEKTPYTESELIDILSMVIKGLAELKKDGIRHDNISIQTILFTNTQFKIYHPHVIEPINSNIQRALVDTRNYSAPEMLKHMRNSEARCLINSTLSDIYSLGLVILDAASLQVSDSYCTSKIQDMGVMISKKITTLKQVYSAELLQILEGMLTEDPKYRTRIDELQRQIGLLKDQQLVHTFRTDKSMSSGQDNGIKKSDYPEQPINTSHRSQAEKTQKQIENLVGGHVRTLDFKNQQLPLPDNQNDISLRVVHRARQPASSEKNIYPHTVLRQESQDRIAFSGKLKNNSGVKTASPIERIYGDPLGRRQSIGDSRRRLPFTGDQVVQDQNSQQKNSHGNILARRMSNFESGNHRNLSRNGSQVRIQTGFKHENSQGLNQQSQSKLSQDTPLKYQDRRQLSVPSIQLNRSDSQSMRNGVLQGSQFGLVRRNLNFDSREHSNNPNPKNYGTESAEYQKQDLAEGTTEGSSINLTQKIVNRHQDQGIIITRQRSRSNSVNHANGGATMQGQINSIDSQQLGYQPARPIQPISSSRRVLSKPVLSNLQDNLMLNSDLNGRVKEVRRYSIDSQGNRRLLSTERIDPGVHLPLHKPQNSTEIAMPTRYNPVPGTTLMHQKPLILPQKKLEVFAPFGGGTTTLRHSSITNQVQNATHGFKRIDSNSSITEMTKDTASTSLPRSQSGQLTRFIHANDTRIPQSEMLNQRSISIKKGDFLDHSSHNSISFNQGNSVIKPPVAPGLKKNPSVKRISINGHNTSLNYNSGDSTSNHQSKNRALEFSQFEASRRNESPVVPLLNLQNPKSTNLASEVRSEMIENLKSKIEDTELLRDQKSTPSQATQLRDYRDPKVFNQKLETLEIANKKLRESYNSNQGIAAKESMISSATVDKNDILGLGSLKSGMLIAEKGLKIRYRKINNILTPVHIDNDDISEQEKQIILKRLRKAEGIPEPNLEQDNIKPIQEILDQKAHTQSQVPAENRQFKEAPAFQIQQKQQVSNELKENQAHVEAEIGKHPFEKFLIRKELQKPINVDAQPNHMTLSVQKSQTHLETKSYLNQKEMSNLQDEPHQYAYEKHESFVHQASNTQTSQNISSLNQVESGLNSDDEDIHQLPKTERVKIQALDYNMNRLNRNQMFSQANFDSVFTNKQIVPALRTYENDVIREPYQKDGSQQSIIYDKGQLRDKENFQVNKLDHQDEAQKSNEKSLSQFEHQGLSKIPTPTYQKMQIEEIQGLMRQNTSLKNPQEFKKKQEQGSEEVNLLEDEASYTPSDYGHNRKNLQGFQTQREDISPGTVSYYQDHSRRHHQNVTNQNGLITVEVEKLDISEDEEDEYERRDSRQNVNCYSEQFENANMVYGKIESASTDLDGQQEGRFANYPPTKLTGQHSKNQFDSLSRENANIGINHVAYESSKDSNLQGFKPQQHRYEDAEQRSRNILDHPNQDNFSQQQQTMRNYRQVENMSPHFEHDRALTNQHIKQRDLAPPQLASVEDFDTEGYDTEMTNQYYFRPKVSTNPIELRKEISNYSNQNQTSDNLSKVPSYGNPHETIQAQEGFSTYDQKSIVYGTNHASTSEFSEMEIASILKHNEDFMKRIKDEMVNMGESFMLIQSQQKQVFRETIPEYDGMEYSESKTQYKSQELEYYQTQGQKPTLQKQGFQSGVKVDDLMSFSQFESLKSGLADMNSGMKAKSNFKFSSQGQQFNPSYNDNKTNNFTHEVRNISMHHQMQEATHNFGSFELNKKLHSIEKPVLDMSKMIPEESVDEIWRKVMDNVEFGRL